MRKTLIATSLIGAGLVSQTGLAVAEEVEQNGLANFEDTQTIVPVNVCNNNVPVNVGGVQVPVQDVAGNIPVLSPSEDKSGNGAGVTKSCKNDVDAENG